MKHRRHRFQKNAFNKSKSSVFTGQKRSLTVASAFVQFSPNLRLENFCARKQCYRNTLTSPFPQALVSMFIPGYLGLGQNRRKDDATVKRVL